MAPKAKAVKCAGCQLKIDKKEPTVEALKKKYHKACFSCTNCNKTIGGDFHPVDDKPFCNDCFLQTKAPRCDTCKEPISGTIMSTNEGQNYHKGCFDQLSLGTCTDCNSKIGFTDAVIEALGNKYHERCFRCSSCQGPVPAQFRAEKGKAYCDKCYQGYKEGRTGPEVCDECSEPIVKGGKVEVPKLGRTFHDECFNRAAWDQCASCSSKVLLTQPSVKVSKLNQFWHLGCLNCGDCNTNIRIQPFYMPAQKSAPCCEGCYLGHVAPKCTACAKAIADDQVLALQQFWHPECFVCAVCSDVLCKLSNEFYNVEGKPMCLKDVQAANLVVVG